jgi:hypothetical protein
VRSQAVSTLKKSQAMTPPAWARRNSAQVGPVRRGAGGSTVAAIVAERLGADLVDTWLVAEVARRAQLPPESVEAEDEHPASLLGRLVAAFAPTGAAPGMVWDAPYN